MYRARRTFIATSMVALLAIAGVTAAIAADPAPAPPPRIAFLANGIVPADALAAGPIAGQLGAPVYTTQQETLPAGTAAALDAYDPQLVIVMGGPVAISDAVVAQVSAATGLPAVDPTPTPATGVVRAAGGDRFETATIVADLLAAYAPAYLPVDVKAVDADKLDGKDSSAFALKSDLGAGGGDADTLDGKDSSAFLGKTEKAADADLLDGRDAGSIIRVARDTVDNNALVGANGNAASTTISAPTFGALVISASSDVFIEGAGSADPKCWIVVDGVVDDPSNRFLHLDSDHNHEEDCSTDAVVAVGPGNHQVDFAYVGLTGTGVTVDETVLSVLFVPFGANGETFDL